MNFMSDNVWGASQPVMAALMAANTDACASYGADPWTDRARAMLGEIFEREVEMYLVATGTGANALSLACLCRPWSAVLCHEESHVMDDECGAPEFFSDGAKLVGLPGIGGKIHPDDVRAALARMPAGVLKQVQPAALSITQATEAGLVYSRDEIRALSEAAAERGLYVHMDGARFANALVQLGCTPAEMTWKCGVDILSFGATKNGCLAAEAVVIFNRDLPVEMPIRRRRGGHTLSKGRLLGAQMVGYLEGGHWLDNARHANAMARHLADGLIGSNSIRLAWPVEANEVFPIVPKPIYESLLKAGFQVRPWDSRFMMPGVRVGADEMMLRLVTSFATKREHVDGLIDIAVARAVS